MDSQTRRIVEAHIFGGKSRSEVASELGVTPNCVSQRLKNGLARLKKSLHLEP